LFSQSQNDIISFKSGERKLEKSRKFEKGTLVAVTHSFSQQGGSGIEKKYAMLDFFLLRPVWLDLTNYVIRHISKYGNIMTSFSLSGLVFVWSEVQSKMQDNSITK
jgi:hypothetical protein